MSFGYEAGRHLYPAPLQNTDASEDAEMTPRIPQINAWAGISTWTAPLDVLLRADHPPFL